MDEHSKAAQHGTGSTGHTGANICTHVHTPFIIYVHAHIYTRLHMCTWQNRLASISTVQSSLPCSSILAPFRTHAGTLMSVRGGALREKASEQARACARVEGKMTRWEAALFRISRPAWQRVGGLPGRTRGDAMLSCDGRAASDTRQDRLLQPYQHPSPQPFLLMVA